MQPGVTVALATVWLAMAAGMVGAVTLRSFHPFHDQYSPTSPRRYGAQRDQINWRDRDPAEDQPFDLWIGSQRSISTTGPVSRNVERDLALEGSPKSIALSKQISPSHWREPSPNTDSKFATDYNDMLLRDVPLLYSDDPFVAENTFQDQGPGSIEIYKLDLSTANLPVEGGSKVKASKKTDQQDVEPTGIKSTNLPTHHRQSNLFGEQRTEMPISRDNFGGMPELQVGCEGLETSSRKARRSIDQADKEGVKSPAAWLDVTPITLDLDYDLSYDEKSDEEMDELFKLKRLEEEIAKSRVKPSRGDMDATLNSAHLDGDSGWPEKLPVRGDLGDSTPVNSRGGPIDTPPSRLKLGQDESREGSLTDNGKAETKRKFVSPDDDGFSRSRGRRLLWLAEPKGFAGERKRTRRSIDWGYGENEGVVTSNELQTVNSRRRQHYMQYHQDASKRDQQRAMSPNFSPITYERERMQEQRRPEEEEERLRQMQQDGRKTPNRRQQEENRRRDEMQRRYEESLRSFARNNSTYNSDDEDTQQREMEGRREQETARETARRNEEERRRREEEEKRREEDEESRRRNRWREEERRRLEEKARKSGYGAPTSDDERRREQEDKQRRFKDEEMRRQEEQYRWQEAEKRRQEEERRRQEEERRRQEEERRRASQEDPARNLSEQDRRRLEQRRREWSERTRQEDEERRRQEARDKEATPSNLMRPGHRLGRPNDLQRPDEERDKRVREQQRERELEQKLRAYIARNRPINVDRADRRSEEETRRHRPDQGASGRANASRDDQLEEDYRRRAEEHRRRQEEERRLQDYVRRSQPVNAPSSNDRSTGRDLLEERRLIEEARQRGRYPDPGAPRIRGPSQPPNIDPRGSLEQVRRKQEETRRLEEEERRRARERQERHEVEERRKELARRRQTEEERRRQEERRKEAARREEEVRRAQSRRYEEDRKRMEEARRKQEEAVRGRARDGGQAAGKTRQPEATRSPHQDPRLLEHRRRQDSRPIPSNLAREEARGVAERERQERARVEAARRRQEQSRTRVPGEREETPHTDQWRRHELVRLHALPVRARIIVRPGGSSSPGSQTVISRGGFENEIDFTGINPSRKGMQVPKFPAPPTTRPPVKSPTPCVWAIVQCCSRNNSRRLKCFESMGCPGSNWDVNPCRPSIMQAARSEIMKFYVTTEEQ